MFKGINCSLEKILGFGNKASIFYALRENCIILQQ